MSEWLIAALKIGFLALLWLFVLIVANTIRTDLFGRAVPAGGASALPAGDKNQSRRPAPRPRRLRILDGRQAGLEIPVGELLDIGRAAESTLVLDDDYCSTHHASIRPDNAGNYIVEDFGSTNGTYVNNNRVTRPTQLGPGDVMRIGRTSMKLVS